MTTTTTTTKTTTKIHTIADCLKALVRAVNNGIKKDSEAQDLGISAYIVKGDRQGIHRTFYGHESYYCEGSSDEFCIKYNYGKGFVASTLAKVVNADEKYYPAWVSYKDGKQVNNCYEYAEIKKEALKVIAFYKEYAKSLKC